MAIVYLALGANLGDREANMRHALEAIAPRVKMLDVSSLYETEPVPAGQPEYLNAAAKIETDLAPPELLAFMQGIERDLGRRPGGKRNAPRPIDIDILLYDDLVLDQAGLVIPHPRMHERGFVLTALVEIAADVRHPVLGKTISTLSKAVGSDGVKRIAERGWDGLESAALD